MTVLFYTLGCKVNQYDTQTLKELFTKNGYTLVGPRDTPDVVVINTCTVTAESDRKGRQAVGRYAKNYPNAIIAVTGCMPQAVQEKADKLTAAHVVVGGASNGRLPALIEQYRQTGEKVVHIEPHDEQWDMHLPSSESFEGRTRAFVKIEDGCNRFCSYCLIPYARGPIRSKPLDAIRDELTHLANNGYKEVVLAGINLTAYFHDGHDLGDVVLMAENIPGLERIRLGSMEPDQLSEEMIDRLADCDKLCPQFHLSLQSGSNTVLQRMNRHYDTLFYKDLTHRLKERFPGCGITTDIMCGFPGETEEEFQETMTFVQQVKFAKVHLFVYSPREGTPAAGMKQVAPNVKKERAKQLATVTARFEQFFLEQQIGKTCPVLFEQIKDGFYEGHTPEYVPVRVESRCDITGKILPVVIETTKNAVCYGVIAE